MLNRTLGILIGLSIVMAMGCEEASDYDVYYTWSDPSANFAQYRTFGFMDVPPEHLEDAPEYVINNNNVLQGGIRAEMLQLGLTESDDPDLWVSSLAATEFEDGYYYDCVPGWYWWGGYYYYDSCAWVDVDYVYYELGTILIPVADSETEQLVFMGAMQGIVDSSENAHQRIGELLNDIFNRWPI